MAKLLKIRRGTTAQHSTFTGAAGEVTMDTDKKTLVAHDGTTAGGNPLATTADLTAAQNTINTTKVSKTSATGSASVPAGTTAQRDGTPSTGSFRFNTSLGKFEGYNGSGWGSVGGGATGGGSDAVFVENDKTVTTNYTITAGKNASTTGPVTIASGVTVTVPSGSRWVIL